MLPNEAHHLCKAAMAFPALYSYNRPWLFRSFYDGGLYFTSRTVQGGV